MCDVELTLKKYLIVSLPFSFYWTYAYTLYMAILSDEIVYRLQLQNIMYIKYRLSFKIR